MPGMWDERDGAFVTFVKTQLPITNQIGAGSNCRCWPNAAKEKSPTLPYMIYTRAGGDRLRHLGSTVGYRGPRRTVLHIYAYGETAESADALIELVITALGEFRGMWSSVIILGCASLMAPDDGSDAPKDASGKTRYWSRLPLEVLHQEL